MDQSNCGRRIVMNYNGVTQYATVVDMVRVCTLSAFAELKYFSKSVHLVHRGLLTCLQASSPSLHL